MSDRPNFDPGRVHRILRLLMWAGALITVGTLMLASPALAQSGIPVTADVPGGTAPLVVLGSGLGLTLAALIFLVRMMGSSWVPRDSREREERLLALLQEASTRESEHGRVVKEAFEREDSYRRMMEHQIRGQQ